jgi:hypothetical protein
MRPLLFYDFDDVIGSTCLLNGLQINYKQFYIVDRILPGTQMMGQLTLEVFLF